MDYNEYFDTVDVMAKKFIKDTGLDDTKYFAQISRSDDNKNVKWAISIAVSNRVQPSYIIEDSPEAAISRFAEFLKDKDFDTVDIVYHKAQIKACEETIEHHKVCIEEITKRKNKESV